MPYKIENKRLTLWFLKNALAGVQFRLIKDSNARDLVRRMLSPFPENRITLSEALNHEWFIDESNGVKNEALIRYGFKENNSKVNKLYKQNMEWNVGRDT